MRERDASAVYDAAARWVDAALRQDDSLFTPGAPIWSRAVIGDLYSRFVEHPDEGKRPFDEKFRDQLSGAAAETIQLAGELLFVHFLPALDISGPHAREVIERVLAWSPQPVEIPPDLAAALDEGFATAGVAYKTRRPAQLRFLLEFARKWKTLEPTEQTRLLTDPWDFKEFLFGLPFDSAQTQRAALLHLVHPDTFESITSETMKKQIAASFADYVSTNSPDLDRKLSDIRAALTEEYGRQFEFWDPDVQTRWGPSATKEPDLGAGEPEQASWVFQANPEIYAIDQALLQLAEIEWTLRQHRSDVHARDRVYIWRSGSQAGVVALGTVMDEPADRAPTEAERPYYLKPEAFNETEPRVNVRVDRVLDRTLTRNELKEHPVLREMTIIRMQGRGTNFAVTGEQDAALRQLLGEGPTIASEPFDVASIIRTATRAPRNLQLDEAIYASVFAALDSGKHVILTGPPGTAKTTLAEAVAEAAAQAGRCSGHVLTTATADWTTYETIGGLRPDSDGRLTFASGHFLEAIEQNRWLVIDELNRSNFDRAFGQLFTVLSGQAVQLPYTRGDHLQRLTLAPAGASIPAGSDVLRIPASWRVIATMNVFDKSLLFEMSFALMRRFAFIEVASPNQEVFEELINQAAGGDKAAAELTSQFLPLRKQKDLGPALFMDMARYLATRGQLDGADRSQLAFEAFYSFLLPQFEGLDEIAGEHLYRQVRRLVGRSYEQRLRETLRSVLGLELSTSGQTETEADQEEDELETPEELGGDEPVDG